jgi:hypothetical protein
MMNCWGMVGNMQESGHSKLGPFYNYNTVEIPMTDSIGKSEAI